MQARYRGGVPDTRLPGRFGSGAAPSRIWPGRVCAQHRDGRQAAGSCVATAPLRPFHDNQQRAAHAQSTAALAAFHISTRRTHESMVKLLESVDSIDVCCLLQRRVRDSRAGYMQSLDVLREAKATGVYTKSSIMLGLGETDDEVCQASLQPPWSWNLRRH